MFQLKCLLCYIIKGMKARLLLAALDWNSRHRCQATSATGDLKFDIVHSKRRKTWVLRVRYAKQEPQHLTPLLQRLLEVHTSKITLPPMEVPQDLPSHMSTLEKPDATILIEQRKTRFTVHE